jgi:hypothetical protein
MNSSIPKSKALNATCGFNPRPMVLHSNKFENCSVYYKCIDLTATKEAKTSIILLCLIRNIH